MIGELAIRFIAGGLVVCLFSFIGDMLQPKSFAGIFGAAPSVALATLGLTFATKGGAEVSMEGKAMIAGAIALLVYSAISGRLLLGKSMSSMLATGITMASWFAVAFGIWAVGLR